MSIPELRAYRTSARSRQRGQALIFGLLFLIAGLISLFFLFNTGQLTEEKTKLVNAADAAAYSAGVMDARGLNMLAYTNRAMMGNTVAIAQLVSVSGWAKYARKFADNGAYVDHNVWWLSLRPAYIAATQGNVLQPLELVNKQDGLIQNYAEKVAPLWIRFRQATQLALMGMLSVSREDVVKDVVKANYQKDGEVKVHVVLGANHLFETFVNPTPYKDADRQRMRDTSEEAANKDGFVRSRSWVNITLFGQTQNPICESVPIIPIDLASKSGGTTLEGFHRWSAKDEIVVNEAFYVWIWGVEFCFPVVPKMWADGSQEAINKDKYAATSAESWQYDEIPSHFELAKSLLDTSKEENNDTMEKDDDGPSLKVTYKVTRTIAETKTSQGRSEIKQTDRLNAFNAKPKKSDALLAMSTAEIFFRRPLNADGSELANDGKRETGSLFNPFWQVRLMSNPIDKLVQQ